MGVTDRLTCGIHGRVTGICHLCADERHNRDLTAALAAKERAEAMTHEHRSEFLGEIQRRVIELGGDPPDWPARNDIEAHDDVESAARMILELLQERDALAAKLAEAERLQLKQSTPPIVRYTLDISDGRMVKSPDGFWASADELAAAYTTIATLTSKLAEAEKDAARYRWLREQYEHTRLPLAAVVWKQNNDRQSSEWVNLVNGDALDAAIDAAISQERSDEH